jgi:hypothetical protein
VVLNTSSNRVPNQIKSRSDKAERQPKADCATVYSVLYLLRTSSPNLISDRAEKRDNRMTSIDRHRLQSSARPSGQSREADRGNFGIILIVRPLIRQTPPLFVRLPRVFIVEIEIL